VRWLSLLPLFRAFHLSAGDAMAGIGCQKWRLAIQLVAALGNFMLNLWCIPRYGWLGAAWTSLITDGALGVGAWLTLYALSDRSSAELQISVTETPEPAAL
jgi:O-antigen/teichoic acid export membrane protein